MRTVNFLKKSTTLVALSLGAVAAHGQIDQSVAQAYFDEARDLSTAEGGLHWGRSLYCPLIFADPITQTHVANEKEPTSKSPETLGYANAAIEESMGTSYQKGWVMLRGKKWYGYFRRTVIDPKTNEPKPAITQKSISQAAIEETLRTFSGTKGALGSLGVYRAAFKAIEQTTPLKENKVKIPILAIGGEKGLGAKVAQMLEAVAEMSPERLSTPAGIHTGRAASGVLPVFPRIRWKGVARG
ncbi:Epoxide hydrolase [Acidisarcina polymorpha]|uniref:Epoxide hydrolase n=1 Tax=Acidisarcina polymorpha TaxID=2211140 RepID=A0A2Z5G0B0_9BACT|nr:hypothetical protein [Acidisarcina polymorpha]AXC12194.1 Epoxide hydrolase [Acidisarcina polymorpha]